MQEDINGWKVWIDEGPPGWEAGSSDVTRIDRGSIDPARLAHIPGANGEHKLFAIDKTGGYGQPGWTGVSYGAKRRRGYAEKVTRGNYNTQ